MTEQDLREEAARVRRQIDRLWSGYTPVATIRRLYHDLDIALENDLRRLERSK